MMLFHKMPIPKKNHIEIAPIFVFAVLYDQSYEMNDLILILYTSIFI